MTVALPYKLNCVNAILIIEIFLQTKILQTSKAKSEDFARTYNNSVKVKKNIDRIIFCNDRTVNAKGAFTHHIVGFCKIHTHCAACCFLILATVRETKANKKVTGELRSIVTKVISIPIRLFLQDLQSLTTLFFPLCFAL